MTTIGDRLREERVRLGKNQSDLGAIGSVTRESVSMYETNKRSPDANYLAAIAGAGADVQYILTGQRSFSISSSGQTSGYPEIDTEFVFRVLDAIEMYIHENHISVDPTKKARLVRLLCKVIAEKRRMESSPKGEVVDIKEYLDAIHLAG